MGTARYELIVRHNLVFPTAVQGRFAQAPNVTQLCLMSGYKGNAKDSSQHSSPDHCVMQTNAQLYSTAS